MGLRSYFKERREAKKYYDQGYRANNLNLSSTVRNDLEKRRERLQRKYEYHSQKGADMGNNLRSFNRGDSDSGLASINNARHKIMAHYYQKKLEGSDLDRTAIRLHRKEGGHMKKVDHEQE